MLSNLWQILCLTKSDQVDNLLANLCKLCLRSVAGCAGQPAVCLADQPSPNPITAKWHQYSAPLRQSTVIGKFSNFSNFYQQPTTIQLFTLIRPNNGNPQLKTSKFLYFFNFIPIINNNLTFLSKAKKVKTKSIVLKKSDMDGAGGEEKGSKSKSYTLLFLNQVFERAKYGQVGYQLGCSSKSKVHFCDPLT